MTAVKFTISDHPQAIDPLLKNCIGTLYFKIKVLKAADDVKKQHSVSDMKKETKVWRLKLKK